MAKSEEGALGTGAQGGVVHPGASDAASGLAGQSVIHGADQAPRTEPQQQADNTVAQVVQIPADPAKEAVQGAVVLELRQMGGLNDAGQGAAPGTEDPSTSQDPEGTETGPGKAGREGPPQGSKGTDQEMGQEGPRLSLSLMKDTWLKKRARASALLTFLQQSLVHARDLLQQLLNLRIAAQALFHLLVQFRGDGDLPHTPVAQADRENPDRAVPSALALLAVAATRFIAVDHATQQRAHQDGGRIRHLRSQSFSGFQESVNLVCPHTQ